MHVALTAIVRVSSLEIQHFRAHQQPCGRQICCFQKCPAAGQPSERSRNQRAEVYLALLQMCALACSSFRQPFGKLICCLSRSDAAGQPSERSWDEHAEVHLALTANVCACSLKLQHFCSRTERGRPILVPSQKYCHSSGCLRCSLGNCSTSCLLWKTQSSF